MLLLSRAVKVYVATQPVRLNRSFDGLSNVVREVMRRDPLSGHIFVFINRRRTMVKLMVWTRGGFTIRARNIRTRVRSGRDPWSCRNRRARTLDAA